MAVTRGQLVTDEQLVTISRNHREEKDREETAENSGACRRRSNRPYLCPSPLSILT